MKSILLSLFALPVFAAEPSLRDQLREALYFEEVSRDTAAAAEAYEKILSDFDDQRPLAASALFRLAEVRRKQDRQQEAIALYQRLLVEFPMAEAEIKLARQNLAGLDAEIPKAGSTPAHVEATEILRLKQLTKTAPDIISDPQTLSSAVENGWPEVVGFLLDQGAKVADSDALSVAANTGRIDLCQLLVQRGEPSKKAKADAMMAAITLNRRAVLSYFLEEGFDANTSIRVVNDKPSSLPLVNDKPSSLLRYAVNKRRPELISLLLEHGADIDFAIDTGDLNLIGTFGTALHQAVFRDQLAIFKLLLENDASPDLPAPGFNLTPLHFAVASTGENSLEMTQTLLRKGADPNRRTTAIAERSTSPRPILGSREYDGVRPLELAWRHRQKAKATALIEAGAKIEQQDLVGTVEINEPEFLKLFLSHHPRFESDDPAAQKLLALAMGKNIDLARQVISHGAAPSPEFIDRLFPEVHRNLIPDLNEAYLLPKLTQQAKIHLLLDQISEQELITLAEATTSSSPPSLSQALLKKEIRYARWSGQKTEIQWLLWRRDQAGQLLSIALAPEGPDPFPELVWGDVIERRILRPEGSPNYEFTKEPPPALFWELSRRISLPITLTIGNTTREITIRGDRLAYDPSKPEVPYLSARRIIDLLRPDLRMNPNSSSATVTIQRADWQDTVARYGSKALERFRFRPGDHMILEIPPIDPPNARQLRLKLITLRIPGTDFLSYLSPPEQDLVGPTLIEAICKTYSAEANSFTRANLESLPRADSDRLGSLLMKINNHQLATPKLLPNPDFSDIRIHRIEDDGSKSLLTIDLSEAISAMGKGALPEQLGDLDPLLKAGDIIDLRLKPTEKPWTGFTKEQAAFFQSELSGTIQIIYSDGDVVRHRINWQPTRWTSTAAGPIPSPPKEGSSSTRARELGFNRYTAPQPKLLLKRDGIDYGDVGFGAFLRDGDLITYGGQQAQQSLPRRAPTTPRVRRVPTPR